MDKNKKYSRFYLWLMRRNITPVIVVLLVLCIITNIAANHYELPFVATITIIVAFILSIIYLIIFNQQTLFDYMHNNQNVSHLPEKQIRRLNKVYMAIFLVVVTVVMFIFMELPYESILSPLWEGIKSVFRFLFSLIRSEENTEVDERFNAPKPKMDRSFWEIDDASTNPIYVYIGMVICIILVAATLCYIIYSVYKKISLREKKDVNEVREFISPFIKKDQLEKTVVRKERSLITDLSYNGRIRRMYKKLILKKLPTKHKPLSPLTPAEIENHVGLGDVETDKLLHDYYEKARYSESGCNKQDYEMLKKK